SVSPLLVNESKSAGASVAAWPSADLVQAKGEMSAMAKTMSIASLTNLILWYSSSRDGIWLHQSRAIWDLGRDPLDSPDATPPTTPGIQDLLACLMLDCSLTSGLFPGRQPEPDTTELSPDPTLNYPLDLLRV